MLTKNDKGKYFYPRPPGGGRPRELRNKTALVIISIHALRVEGDPRTERVDDGVETISIHALRVEGDWDR